MPDVFANGIEVSGKSVGAKTIAAFPDVCMTPPENPATPPGVPIPYPNFAMAGDTEKGTGTVKVKKKEINLKNKSDMSKTSGDEAGSAAKKGVVSSKNTGKSYFKAWSPNVKAEGEPVTRMSDVTTNNHGSPPNAPPWPHIAKVDFATVGCAKILQEFNMEPKPYNKLKCDTGETGKIKEHTIEAQFFTVPGVRDLTTKCMEAYSEHDAPTICYKDTWKEGDAAVTGGGAVVGKKRGSPHYYKSAAARNALKEKPTMEQFTNTCVKSTVDNHDDPPVPEDRKEEVMECLKAANEEYVAEKTGRTKEEQAEKKQCDGSCAWSKNARSAVAAAKAAQKAAGVKSPKVLARHVSVSGSCGSASPAAGGS